MDVLKYRIFCATEGINKEVILPADVLAPTTCPSDGTHTVDPSSVVVVGKSQSLVATDADGALLARTKQATKGWSFQARGCDLITSKVQHSDPTINMTDLAISTFRPDGTGWGDITVTHFDAAGNPLITSDQSILDSQCVTTWFDWEPDYDYEIIGGNANIAAGVPDVRLWIIGAPYVPSSMGGNVTFASGINLSAAEKVNLDGRTSKRLFYNPVYHSNMLRLMVVHPVGAKAKISLVWEHYKS